MAIQIYTANGNNENCKVLTMKKSYKNWTIIATNKILKSGYVMCRCSCGTEKPVNKYHLRDGKSTSCGKCKNNNLINKRFGKLVVTGFSHVHIRNGQKHSNWWYCKCDCGKEVIRPTASLLKSSTSCNDPKCKFGWGVSAQNRLFATYKKLCAGKRKLSFTITLNQFIKLTSDNCYYCGCSPVSIQKSTHNNGNYQYNGLDRVDNSKGYTIKNVVTCCKYCNSAKSTRTSKEFNEWIKQLIKHHCLSPKWDNTKCWGRVWHRFYDKNLGESLLEVEAGWRCSIHWHEHRWNCFAIIDATIIIETFGPSNNQPSNQPSTITLEPGSSFVVQPLIWHRFRVLQSGRIAEMYWTTDGIPCCIDDIIRYDVGGRDLPNNHSW